jgi:pimeloyl-ACP methyl ester carboxylesterase
MNGTLALAAAAEVLCAGVVAVGAPPRLPIDAEVRRAYWEANAEPERRRRAAAPDADHDRLQRWYDLDFEPSDIDSPAVTDLDMRWIQGIFEDAATLDWDATMRAVSCPVLLALGEYDFLVPPTLWTDAVRPARTTVEVFSRSGHTPFVEQPDEFLAAFDRWVAAGAQ